MRVLLDENVPRKLKYRLAPEHDAVTVPERGWAGRVNGALLRSANAEFDAFVTLDRGIEYQQDLSNLTIRVLVIRSFSSKYEDLLPLVPSVHAALARLSPGGLAHVAGCLAAGRTEQAVPFGTRRRLGAGGAARPRFCTMVAGARRGAA